MADGGEGAPAVELAGCHNRADVRIDFGAPDGPEAIGDFSEDDRRPQGPFGDIVGGRNIAVGNEYEQLVAAVRDCPFEFEASLAVGRGGQQSIEPAVEGAPIGG